MRDKDEYLWERGAMKGVESSEAMKNLMDELVTRAQEIYGDLLANIILYGSCARNEDGNQSDVDVMFLLDCEDAEAQRRYYDIVTVSSDLSLDYDIVLSSMFCGKDDFYGHCETYPLYRNVMEEGVIFYG